MIELPPNFTTFRHRSQDGDWPMLLRAVIRSLFAVLAFMAASSARAQEVLPLQVPPPTSEMPSENPVDAQLVAPPPSTGGKSALEERLKEDPAFRKDLEGFMEKLHQEA
jgi:hypothetical protein